MPCVDMSLEKLHQYQGCNPKPHDFDEFWDKSLAELAAIDPNPVYTPVDLPSAVADCFELRFTSTKGATIFARVAKPKNVTGRMPALLSLLCKGSCPAGTEGLTKKNSSHLSFSF